MLHVDGEPLRDIGEATQTVAVNTAQQAVRAFNAALAGPLCRALGLLNYETKAVSVLSNVTPFRQSLHYDASVEMCTDGPVWSFIAALHEHVHLNVYSEADSRLWRIHVPKGQILAFRGDVLHSGASKPTPHAEDFKKVIDSLMRTGEVSPHWSRKATLWAKNVWDCPEGVHDCRVHGYLSPRLRLMRTVDFPWETAGGVVIQGGELDTVEGMPGYPY